MFDLFEIQDGSSINSLQEEALDVLERDSKHALKSPDDEERLLGVRSAQLLDY